MDGSHRPPAVNANQRLRSRLIARKRRACTRPQTARCRGHPEAAFRPAKHVFLPWRVRRATGKCCPARTFHLPVLPCSAMGESNGPVPARAETQSEPAVPVSAGGRADARRGKRWRVRACACPARKITRADGEYRWHAVPWRSSPVGVPSRASPIRQRSCIALPGARFRAHSGSGGGNEWKGAAFPGREVAYARDTYPPDGSNTGVVDNDVGRAQAIPAPADPGDPHPTMSRLRAASALMSD